MGAIADSASDGQTVRLPPALLQPIASDDVAAALAEVAVAEPLDGMVELAGPESIPLDELARRYLKAKGDARQVTTDVHARYYGTESTIEASGPAMMSSMWQTGNPSISTRRRQASSKRSMPSGANTRSRSNGRS